MPTLSDALGLAESGWAVLPLRGKIPLTAHGVKDASTDLDQVRAWWPGDTQHNIGARVPSEVVVLDFDPQNGGSVAALEDAAGVALPDTLTVHSGRGTGGQHRYYLRPPGLLTSTRLPDGIDVKTDRGYCVMPPSLHPLTGRPYRWEMRPYAALPTVLIDLLHPPTPIVRPRPADTGDGVLARRALYLARHVEQLPEGQRNAGLFWAACRAVEDGHPQDTFDLLEGAAIVAGLTEHEARRTIASARRQGGHS
jgi:hypothetical protein